MRLIDADVLLEELEESIGKMVDWAAREPVCSPVYNMLRNKLDEREHFRNMIINAPTVERPRGEWINEGGYVTTAYGSLDVYRCSHCDQEITIDNFDSYCPNCGADMRGAGE